MLFLHYKCPQTEKVVQVYSKHIQFGFTLRGQRYFKHGGKTWTCSPKKGWLMKKCAFAQEMPDRWADWDILSFYITDEYLKVIFEELKSDLNLEDLPEPNQDMIEEVEVNDEIRAGYEGLIPYFGRKKPLPETILEGKFKELMFNIFSHPKNRSILAFAKRVAKRYKIPIWEVMEENYMYDLKISDFANIAGRSLAAFKRDFKEYYKTSPGRWLTERRLKRAKFQLETSDKTIKEVAFDCGFANASHFSRVFKEQFRESPSQVHA